MARPHTGPILASAVLALALCACDDGPGPTPSPPPVTPEPPGDQSPPPQPISRQPESGMLYVERSGPAGGERSRHAFPHELRAGTAG